MIPDSLATSLNLQKLQPGLLSGIRNISELKIADGKAKRLLTEMHNRLFSQQRKGYMTETAHWTAEEGQRRRQEGYMKYLKRVQSCFAYLLSNL